MVTLIKTLFRTRTSRSSRRSRSVSYLGALLLSLSTLACGEPEEKVTDDPEQDTSETTNDPDPATSEPTILAPSSLCSLPKVPTKAKVPLTKALLIERLTNYSMGWLTPLNEALLGIDENKLFENWIDGVQSTFDKVCRSETDWDVFPPDDALTNETKRADYRQSLEDFFAQAIEVETGEHLRLSFHECEDCSEPIGATPMFFDVTLDEGGLITATIELTEGTPWTKKVYITETGAAVELPLEALMNWGDTASESLRSGESVFPNGSGTVFLQAFRDAAGHMSASLGISELDLTVNPGMDTETRVTSSSPCIGLSAKLAPPEEGSSATFVGGETDITMKGKTHCPNASSCGDLEDSGTFAYHFGGGSVTVAQSPLGAAYDSTIDLAFSSESTATIDGETFAHGGLGDDGSGGEVRLGSKRSGDAYLISFEPKLDLAGAMILTKISEETRVSWPDALNDEIFDLTFGGDPVGTIRVPVRELCPEGVYPKPEVERREVEVVSGSGTLTVGDGRVLQATAGQCIGNSLSDSTSFDLISDYWEAGFTCSE